MDFAFSEEHELLRQTVREFAHTEILPVIQKYDEAQEFPTEIFRKLGELGMLGVFVPEQYGGAGLSYVDYVTVVSEISRVDGSTGLGIAAHNSLCTNHIFSCGNEEQKRRYLPALTSGEWIGAWALTEPGAGSDASSLRCTAARDGSGWVLNGTKAFCTHGGVGQVCVVLTVTDKSKGYNGISAFIVEKGTPGFRASKKENKMGCRSSDTAELVFEDCHVGADALLGQEGQGLKDSLRVLAGGRIGIAALGLGIAQGALDEALRYAKVRTAFHKRLCDHEGIQFHLANMHRDVEAAALLCYRAADLRDRGFYPVTESCMAKLFSSETAVRACDLAVQIHGAYGYVKEYTVERLYRDAKLCTIGEGTSEIQRTVIARGVVQRADHVFPEAG